MRALRVGCFGFFSFLFLFAVLNPAQAVADSVSSVGVSVVGDVSGKPVPTVTAEQQAGPSTVNKILTALPDWLQLLSLIISACAGLAALTPTPKDDSALLVLRKIVDFLALNVGGAKNAGSNKNPRDIS